MITNIVLVLWLWIIAGLALQFIFAWCVNRHEQRVETDWLEMKRRLLELAK